MNTENDAEVERKDKCVYVHKLDGEVMYVGSGNEERAVNIGGRKGKHLELWHSLDKEIIARGLTLKEAIELEQETIDKYWDTGKLFNRSKNVAKHLILSYEYLSQHFYLDGDSPSGIRWKSEPSTKTKMHTVAGTMKVTSPYWVVQLNKHLYQVHRVIWCLHTKKDFGTGMVIDHIDRNGFNNSIDNLRLVTQSENTRNKKHKGSNCGEQCIHDNVKQKYFSVTSKQDNNSETETFSYYKETQRKAKNHYETREDAFAAAIACRNQMVADGKIILT